MEELAEQMTADRQIAIDMASKMAEEREMTKQMSEEVSKNCKLGLNSKECKYLFS